MALDGFTIGSAPASGSGAPSPAPAPTGGGSALSGFKIGVQAPKAPASSGDAPAASTTPSVADLVANTPPAPDTSGLFSKFLSMTGFSAKPAMNDETTTPSVAIPSSQPVVGPDGKITVDLNHPLDALPAISSKLSADINRPYVAIGDYLKSRVHIAPEVSSSVTAHILEHLSALNPANLAEGITGGFYQSPATQRQNAANAAANASGSALEKLKTDITTSTDELETLKAKLDARKASVDTSDQKSVDAFNAMVEDFNAKQKLLQPKVDAYNAQLGKYTKDNEKAIALHGDFIDQTLSALTKAAGAVIGIAAGGELATPAAAVSSVQGMLSKSPLLAKYAGPYVEGFVKTLTGLGIQSQLDPKLAGDLTKRATSLGIAIGTAPLYTALGLIKSPLYSIPASFGLGFGMAKLSGASNEEAIQSGLVFGIMDGVTRAYGTYNRGLSPEDIQIKLRNEAFDTLNRYSGTKLTEDSTPDEIKAAYRKAIFQTHPDVGGSQESASAVTNAYDLLTRGAHTQSSADVHTTTEEGAQVSELGNAVKSGVAEHGPDVMHSALQEHLGVDSATATRIVTANSTPEEVNPAAILREITGKAEPAPHALPGVVIAGTEPNTLEGMNPKQPTKLSSEEAAPFAQKAADAYWESRISPSLKSGGPAVIGADDLKDYFGNDYNDNNHPAYSRAAYHLFERALKENPATDVVLTGGGPASGKTELLVKKLIAEGFKGTVYDSNMSSREGVEKQIAAVRAAGKELRIYGVLPNLSDARSFSIQRENRIGRGISDATFARGHTKFPEVIEGLLKDGIIKPEDVKLLDTRSIKGFEQAFQKVMSGDFLKDPLAVLRMLDYNEGEIKQLYGKENFNKETGESDSRDGQDAHQLRVRGGAREASPSDRADQGDAERKGDESVLAKTQKERVAEVVAQEPLSIKEVAKLTGILEPNVRRILGVGAKDGTFQRVSEGVYVLKTKAGNYAYVEMGDAEVSLARMAKEGQKFDSVILDPAYFSRALIGGNRGIKQWNFIQPDSFAKVMKSVADVVKYPDSHVYLMLSGARTAQPDMDQYVKGAVDADFKVVGEGSFTKLNKNGTPSTNVRGKEAAAERLILMTKTGTARDGEISANLHFRFVRVLGKYQTEKPAELMKALIEQSTLEGETVLDPFAGSGVTGAEALKAHRNAVLIEKQKTTVEGITKPRVEAAVKDSADKVREILKTSLGELKDTADYVKPSEAFKGATVYGFYVDEYHPLEVTVGKNGKKISHGYNYSETAPKVSVNEKKPVYAKKFSDLSDIKQAIISYKMDAGDQEESAAEIISLIEKGGDDMKELAQESQDAVRKYLGSTIYRSGREDGLSWSFDEDVAKTMGGDVQEKVFDEDTLKRVIFYDGLPQKQLGFKWNDWKDLMDFQNEEEILLAPENVDPKTLSLTPSELTKEKTGLYRNMTVPVAEINGERRELPPQLVSKTDIKNLVGTLPGKQGDFLVVDKDGEKRMELDTPTGHMSLRPSALGLLEDDINVGDTIHVDAEELKKKGPAFRVKDRYGANRGFISIDPLIKAMEGADAAVKDFVENTLQPIKISGNLTDSFVKLEGAAQADLEAVNKLFNTLEINKADDEALYAHAEDPDAPLTQKQRELEATFDGPLKEANAVLYKRIKDLGIPLEDESETYISRFPKGKASVLQRVFNPSLDRTGTTKQGSVLSKSTSSLKKRTMKILTDSSGKRTVVAIKDGQVTAFVNKQATPLGTLDRTITPKVKEFFDPSVRSKLEKLAADLGVTHERHATGATLGLGGQRAGVSFQGESLIKTRLSPDSVLAHELGHQIDHKYGMQGVMKEERYDALHRTLVLREMKALADKRFESKDVSENFKKYVRKGSEKMAVMFEAYISNKAMFKEVAPHLYDSFVDFLSEHKELQPFLDIKSGVQLGSTTHGGEHIAGKNGTAFIDKDGKKYTIGDATTAEIEKHTDLEYYHSAAASRLLQYVKLRQIDRALQFLETWKASADFAKVAVKNDEIPPPGWKMTSQINFRNYYFEPRIAEALDDFQGQMDRGAYNDAFRGINRVLADAIFFNGLAHPINVAVTWLFQRGASSYVNPYAYGRAFRAGARALRAMSEKNADYMMLLKQGAHLMSSDVSNQKLAENMARRLGDALDTQPELGAKIMKAVGWTGDQFSFRTNIIYKFSHDMAWLSNDFLTMQAVFERMERDGMSMEEAIRDTARFIPEYRDQSRLLDAPLSAAGKLIGKEKEGGATARWLAKIVYNRNISLFASYHVGLLQSLTNTVKDTFNAGEGFGDEANKKRAQGADKIAMLALLMVVIYPWLDKEARKLTGDANTYATRSGVTKYPYLAYKWAVGNTTTSQALQQIITPAVGTELLLEQFFDHDFFTGNQLSGPGGEGRLKLTLNAIAPYNEYQRWATGKTNIEDFMLTLLGVHTPKNTQTALDLNAMIYTEKPQVNAQAKARIVAGDQAGALALVTAFNDRLSAQIRKADATTGDWTPAVADARVKYFINQYGLRMPGTVAIENYAAKQGKNIIDRTLPNGKPVVVKDTAVPATGVIGVITTYARAIGSDPVTAFKDIFSGQSIRAVENGNIIVQRMALSESQTKKKALGGGTIPKGMTLDHIQPLEGGGTNEDGNLQLITTAQDKANQAEEDFVGRQLKAGTMTSAQAREVSIRYKAGQGQPLSPSLMQEYADKYGSKPMTLEQVYDFTHNL